MEDEDSKATGPDGFLAAKAFLWALVSAAACLAPAIVMGASVETLPRYMTSESILAALGLAMGATAFKLHGVRARRLASAVAISVFATALAALAIGASSSLWPIPRNLIALTWGFLGAALLSGGEQGRHLIASLTLALFELGSLATLACVGTGALDTAALVAAHVFLLAVSAAFLLLRQKRKKGGETAPRGIPQAADASKLTDREREVVNCLSEGRTQAEIAKTLGISPSTVSTYRARALKKLGVDTLEIDPLSRSATHRPPYPSPAQLAFPVALLAGASILLSGAASLTDKGPDLRILACTIVAVVPFVARITGQRPDAESCPGEHEYLGALLSLATALLARELLIWRDSLPLALGLFAGCLVIISSSKMRRGRICTAPDVWKGGLFDDAVFSATLLLRQFPGNDVTAVRIGPVGITSAGTALTLSVALLAFLFWLLSAQFLPAGELPQIANTDLDARRCNFLLAKGLNQTQARVALDIAKGLSSSQIAAREHLSSGSINSARLVAYRKLGINSRRDLVAVLEREVS